MGAAVESQTVATRRATHRWPLLGIPGLNGVIGLKKRVFEKTSKYV
jgi:hypothetical protein